MQAWLLKLAYLMPSVLLWACTLVMQLWLSTQRVRAYCNHKYTRASQRAGAIGSWLKMLGRFVNSSGIATPQTAES